MWRCDHCLVARSPDAMLHLQLFSMGGSLSCRPVAVAQRTAEVLSTAALVGAGLLYDRFTGNLRKNAPLRAAQVRISP